MVNDVYNELSQNFIEYAVAVNTDRAIPDAKSGLKPVAKRIIWSAFESGYTSNKKHIKSAKIVGNVIGTYHPHGDSSVYEALVRLSRPWVVRYPLIDFHGNNGNISGDDAAHMRYTEARLSPIAEEGLLSNIKKNNVDFIPNYDETTVEPLTFPAIFPNLLCNPNEGIGVAMAAKWAPHNLREVAKAIIEYAAGKENVTLPGPDFPTGGIIINKDDIPNIMKTGHGSVKIRGKYKIDGQQIIFYEIPYGETIEGIIASIGKAAEENKIEHIEDVHDESNKKGIRIVITIEKEVNPETILNKLFAKTNLQVSFSYNQIGLVDKTPTELNLIDCIKIYLNHNIDCLIKELNFNIEKAEKREEVVDGLLKALASIDEIVALIRGSESAGVAKELLIKKYEFTELQAKSILSMRLSSLAKLEGIELNNERATLENNLKEWNNIISTKERQIEVIISRLNDIVKKYGDDRRTELAQIDIIKEKKEKEIIIPENVIVIVTQNGEVKRIPKSNFKVQKKNGKGIKSTDSSIMTTIATNTLDSLMIFTNSGKMYKFPVNKVPEGTNTSTGTNLHLLTTMDVKEKVAAVTSLYHNTDAEYVLFFTKKGIVKKTKLEEYINIKRGTGTQAIKFKTEDDTLANVTFLKNEDVIIVTKKGITLRFNGDIINATGRATMGVKGIALSSDDEVVIGLPIKHPEDNLAIISENGIGKKMALSDFVVQTRGSKGMKISVADNIVGAAIIDDDDYLLIIGQSGCICISAKDVSKNSKTAKGNSLINTNKVLSMVKI